MFDAERRRQEEDRQRLQRQVEDRWVPDINPSDPGSLVNPGRPPPLRPANPTSPFNSGFWSG